MDVEVMLVFGLAILIIAVAILTIILNLKPKGKSVDYRSLFIMGIIWAFAGLIIKNWPLRPASYETRLCLQKNATGIVRLDLIIA